MILVTKLCTWKDNCLILRGMRWENVGGIQLPQNEDRLTGSC